MEGRKVFIYKNYDNKDDKNNMIINTILSKY